MKKNFEFVIASPIEKENLVCEIYFKNEIIAEISQETDQPLLTLFSPQSKWWEVPLKEFQEVLEEALIHLRGEK